MEIRGRRALVTGATGGLGGAIARRLGAGGADLVFPDAANALARRGPMARMHAQIVDAQRHTR